MRRRHGTHRQQRQIDEMASVKRNLLHRLLVDHRADRYRGVLDHRLRGLNLHGLTGGGDLQREILLNGASHFEHQVVQDDRLHALRFHLDAVIPYRQGCRGIETVASRFHRAILPGALIVNHYLCVRNHRSGSVSYYTLDRCCRLRLCGWVQQKAGGSENKQYAESNHLHLKPPYLDLTFWRWILSRISRKCVAGREQSLVTLTTSTAPSTRPDSRRRRGRTCSCVRSRRARPRRGGRTRPWRPHWDKRKCRAPPPGNRPATPD